MSNRPVFDRLQDAAAFIERCLDSNDVETLLSACDDRPDDPRIDPIRVHRTRGFNELARFNAETHISDACSDAEFPSDDTRFTVGGVTWGCVAVFFHKTNDGWVIGDIGVTR